MKLSDLVGLTAVDPDQAVAHINTWFGADDLVCLVGMRQHRGRGKNVLSQAMKARDLVGVLRSDNRFEFLEGLTVDEDGNKWNVYVGVSAVEKGVTAVKRGGLDNIAAMPGVWADLDVKSGSFESEEEILAWAKEKLPVPTLAVTTGSGGVHLYWKTEQPLPLFQARELQKRWWSYVAAQAGEKSIDRLIDPSRILRLAGTVRWPKDGETALPAQTVIRYRDPHRKYTLETLYGLSAAAWEEYNTRVTRTRQNDAQRRLEADELAKLALEGKGQWALYAAIASVEETVNQRYTWDEILEPHGWTFLREDYHGRREWARPGRAEKSATTDWVESPNMMSLLSWSEETGLYDLREAGVHLSKYRVLLRLKYNDDATALVKDVLDLK